MVEDGLGILLDSVAIEFRARLGAPVDADAVDVQLQQEALLGDHFDHCHAGLRAREKPPRRESSTGSGPASRLTSVVVLVIRQRRHAMLLDGGG